MYGNAEAHASAYDHGYGEDLEMFERIRRTPKSGNQRPERSDQHIREARRLREHEREALIENVEAE